MKAIRVLLIVLVICASAAPVLALPQWMVKMFGMCDDGDNGPADLDKPIPFIAINSYAADSSGKQFDECLNEHGEKAPTGKTVRERVCGKDNNVFYKDYDCTKYDFAACIDIPGKGAACVRDIPSTRCGDGMVQPPEKCDPPGAACVTAAGKIGVCNPGCQCMVAPPKKCGNKRLDAGEQCDPPGANCVSPAGKPSVCNPGCQCPEPPKSKCGDNKIQPPEQCDPPGKVCKNAKGEIGACTNQCNCDVPQKPRCGDTILNPGEQCDPPGAKCMNAAGLDATCSQDCKCPITRIRTWCSNNRVDPWEDCDPPGVRCVKGGRPGMCNDYCMCAGEGGLLLPGEKLIVGQPPVQPPPPGPTPPPQTPPPQPPTEPTPPPQPAKSCEQLCSERGMSLQQPDHSQMIMSYLQQYSCVSGARIAMKGSLTLTGAGVNCKCYSREPPTINVDSNPPVCQTPCGPVQCGSSTSCPCPDQPNCVLTASCTWGGWKWQQGQPIPILGTQSAMGS